MNGSTDAAYSSKPTVARRMNSMSQRSEWMISRAVALASATSVPTSSPSQVSAHLADAVRRGSTTNSLAPLWTALRT